MLFAD
ncbi:MAG: hypothetical protein EZS28_045148, partial [Streblomastix strix]